MIIEVKVELPKFHKEDIHKQMTNILHNYTKNYFLVSINHLLKYHGSHNSFEFINSTHAYSKSGVDVAHGKLD